ncbi:hypothetical protein [Alteromonas sp. KUL49]|uniref:hypothetical protein n=1 Tax=Alteromonas sp. KUL49 TaxID=2480798 RepID=UPI00102F14CB|nr:hypothetical protein [Alteromonas sp. KUL49]TAP38916.1 hypothetical protein EYS00_13545 [Alteromonas sp. KUL49]GEA12353.1 hypothetical protein KUL49_27280 [Alteromonas sp. KUL49]
MYDFKQLLNGFDINNAPIDTLLVLRVTLDKADPIQDIEQDLLDLPDFPERLFESYVDEWKSFIKRQCKVHNIGLGTASREKLVNKLQALFSEREPWCKKVLQLGLEQITYVTQIQSSENIQVLTSSRKRAIERLLSL